MCGVPSKKGSVIHNFQIIPSELKLIVEYRTIENWSSCWPIVLKLSKQSLQGIQNQTYQLVPSYSATFLSSVH